TAWSPSPAALRDTSVRSRCPPSRLIPVIGVDVLAATGEEGGDHLISEEPKLVSPSHRLQVLAVDLVADIADGAVHHLGHMGGREDGGVLAPQLFYGIDVTHSSRMVLNVVTVENGIVASLLSLVRILSVGGGETSGSYQR